MSVQQAPSPCFAQLLSHSLFSCPQGISLHLSQWHLKQYPQLIECGKSDKTSQPGAQSCNSTRLSHPGMLYKCPLAAGTCGCAALSISIGFSLVVSTSANSGLCPLCGGKDRRGGKSLPGLCPLQNSCIWVSPGEWEQNLAVGRVT